jgi:metal iron transporter
MDANGQPFWRRLITRLIGVIPAAAVAASVGPAGLNTMLVASQVLLSIVLPTVIFPLVYLCSREDLMTVTGPELAAPSVTTAAPTSSSASRSSPAVPASEPTTEPPQRLTKSFRTPRWITWLGYALFGVVVLANCYVIVELGLGNAGS